MRHGYDYPITVDYSIASYVDSQNYSLSGTVDMTQTLTDSVLGTSTENVRSYGVLARTNGVVTAADGHSTSYYAAPGYFHYLATEHGLITKDVSH